MGLLSPFQSGIIFTYASQPNKWKSSYFKSRLKKTSAVNPVLPKQSQACWWHQWSRSFVPVFFGFETTPTQEDCRQYGVKQKKYGPDLHEHTFASRRVYQPHGEAGFLADAVELASVSNKDETTLSNMHFYQCRYWQKYWCRYFLFFDRNAVLQVYQSYYSSKSLLV